jgi:hypothetical protein
MSWIQHRPVEMEKGCRPRNWQKRSESRPEHLERLTEPRQPNVAGKLLDPIRVNKLKES